MRALDILDDEGTIDIDERATSWRREGWTGYGAGASATRSTEGGLGSSTAPSAATGSAASAGGRTAQPGREEVIPVTEEQLKVGKRDISHGRARVRSYVIEKPVQEQVNLAKNTCTSKGDPSIGRPPEPKTSSGSEPSRPKKRPRRQSFPRRRASKRSWS
jgi:hypothetical protein